MLYFLKLFSCCYDSVANFKVYVIPFNVYCVCIVCLTVLVE